MLVFISTHTHRGCMGLAVVFIIAFRCRAIAICCMTDHFRITSPHFGTGGSPVFIGKLPRCGSMWRIVVLITARFHCASITFGAGVRWYSSVPVPVAVARGSEWYLSLRQSQAGASVLIVAQLVHRMAVVHVVHSAVGGIHHGLCHVHGHASAGPRHTHRGNYHCCRRSTHTPCEQHCPQQVRSSGTRTTRANTFPWIRNHCISSRTLTASKRGCSGIHHCP